MSTPASPVIADSPRHKRWLAYSLLLTASLLWAGNTIIGRGLAQHISPLGLSFWRWLLAFGLLTLLNLPRWPAYWRDYGEQIRERWKTLVSLTFFGVVCYNAFQYWALRHSPAINVALVASAIPIVILPLSVVVLKVRPAPHAWLGVGLSSLGVLVVLSRGELGNLLQLSVSKGDAIMFVAVIAWGIYTIILRKAPLNMPIRLSLNLQIGLGCCLLFPAYAVEILFNHDAQPPGLTLGLLLPPLTPNLGVALLYLAVGPSLLSYLCWDRGVSLIGAPAAGVFINFIPIFAAFLAVMFLGESFHLYHALGLGLLLAGVGLINKHKAA
ncbi:DMT family transporter [Parvibium lacunae]|uniref:DMT family transporter n=1 Tax=Parvibium lacunae TaxID=1888893 RepID=A0A368L7J2_9BURK|nr:DMT family transporter [Parvibium lacunae]RCS59635.1 DMT family transporter [Parvibium lacunae]